MTDKEIKSLIELTLTQKIEENHEFIKYSFYETDVKYNLKPIDKYTFLRLLRNKLENNNYKVYTPGHEYVFNGETKKVQENEELIAIKEKKEDVNNGTIQRKKHRKIK
ncbi:MAG: hypothetical protein J6M60_00520 [Clostridia bacterium]|nr:hypothetical protein [Clostridia bacterium]